MNKWLRQFDISMPTAQVLDSFSGTDKKPYDPEMIYVECRLCGRPVLWEPGRTTAFLVESNINPFFVDERCLIISDGCNICSPGTDSFHLNIVRLSNIPASALMLLRPPKGHA